MSKVEKNKPKRSTQGGLTLWHGMRTSDLLKLLAKRPNMHWSRWSRIGLLPPMAAYNSMMAAVENFRYSKTIEQTELKQPPVFILGYWRSGTTFLHNLVTADPQFTFPTMYQTLFPWHFLTTQKVATKLTGWMVPKSRPMDNVKVHWDVPQEDDLALCIMSQISPYTLLAFPEDMEGYQRSFDIQNLPESEQKLWKDSLMLLMKKITVQENKPIVIKSPSHTYRIQVLTEMFPEAKFIYLYRNPFDVFNSTVHLRKTMIDENTLGKTVFKDCEQGVIDTYNYALEAYDRDKHLIPKGNLHEVRYESLAENPLAEMEKLYANLGLSGFEQAREILIPQIAGLKEYKKNKFSPDPYWVNKVNVECREAFERFDYPMLSESGKRQEAAA